MTVIRDAKLGDADSMTAPVIQRLTVAYVVLKLFSGGSARGPTRQTAPISPIDTAARESTGISSDDSVQKTILSAAYRGTGRRWKN